MYAPGGDRSSTEHVFSSSELTVKDDDGNSQGQTSGITDHGVHASRRLYVLLELL